MTTNQEPLTHEDYADAAESAERGRAWAQAAVLWRRAIDHLPTGRNAAKQRGKYSERARECDREATLGERFEDIAKRILRIPTLAERRSDSLDFHEVGVWQVKQALKAAYEAGQNDAK
jgi:hypothetical protein